MQSDSNDCLAFHNSLGSTNCAISEEDDNPNLYEKQPTPYRSKFFSEDLIGTTFETESIELDMEVDPINQTQDHFMCNSIMNWFHQRGVVAGNPEQIWVNVNRELHKRTYEIIQNRSLICFQNLNSTLLQRRLNRSMNLSM